MNRIAIFQLDNFQMSPFSRNLFNLVPELQKRGFEVDVLTTDSLGADALPAGVWGKVFAAWVPPWLKLPRHYLAIPEMSAYIRRRNPDVIIARGVPFGVPAILARYLSFRKPIILTTLHVAISGDIEAKMHRSWPIFRSLTRFVIAKGDHTVAVSKGVARDYAHLIGIPAKRIKVIYNPVVGMDIQTRGAEPVDEPWFASSRAFSTLVHVGRFAPEKDHGTLLRALAEVRKTRDVRLLLIGDGPLRPAICEYVADLGLEGAVKLLGRKENPFAYMARADALVLSSRYEGLPGVLIQALALGCPVASTNCESGADEILEDGKWGPLTPVGDSVRLAAAIASVLDSPLAKQRLIERSLFFSASESAERLLDLIGSQA